MLRYYFHFAWLNLIEGLGGKKVKDDPRGRTTEFETVGIGKVLGDHLTTLSGWGGKTKWSHPTFMTLTCGANPRPPLPGS